MKAITLTQPWATLVAIGAKRIETRSWRTHYRGPLAIHAAKGWTKEAVRMFFREPFKSTLAMAGYPIFSTLPRGCIVATATLVDCIKVPRAQRIETAVHADSGEVFSVLFLPPTGLESFFGDYSPGRYAWLLNDVKRLDPVAVRGALGLWNWERAND